MYKKIITISAILLLFAASAPAYNDMNIPYKLAVMHTRNLTPLESFLGKTQEPSDSIVSEFRWILDSLKHRCINPETAIADTIVETWNSLNKNGYKMSILDTARELSRIARNTRIFGTDKVNFRMTSKLWLMSKISGESIETVIQSSNIQDYR